jgi:quinoprotein glucose dehydrogenase
MPRVIETDVCILGGGITAAMTAEKLTERSTAKVIIVEAGDKIFNFQERYAHRKRFLDYNENPYPNDHIRTQTAIGIQSRSMCVGGLAMHWGGATPRFTPEDFRLKTMFGVGDDWPITYDDLEPFYQEAEERIGVAGVQGPANLDIRSKPYPLPPLPLSYNLVQLKEWAGKSGIPFWPNPVAKLSQPYHGRSKCMRCDTCNICPTGAKYSPDFTFQNLLQSGRIELYDRTLVRKLSLSTDGRKIEEATAINRDRPDDPLRFRAKIFVLAAGYAWTSHLLLLNGVANRSGLVGRYMTGHRNLNAFVEVPLKLYPGIYTTDSLLSKHYQRPGKLDKYVRHDLRIWEAKSGRDPRLKDESGKVLLGDEVLADWRKRTSTGSARLRAYYDVIPSLESALTLDSTLQNEWGDPLPRIQMADSNESRLLRDFSENQIRGVFENLVRAGGGKILSVQPDRFQDHPGGGCRMGTDPSKSVVNSFGRSHDHENLWIAGAPTVVSGGCCNGTLTFAALSLRSAGEIGKELPARRSGL